MSHGYRSSISHTLRRIVDATEDLVDDALERAEDVESDVRESLSDALDDDEYPRRRRRRRRRRDRGPRGATQSSVPRAREPEDDDLQELREQLAELTRRLDRLSDAPR